MGHGVSIVSTLEKISCLNPLYAELFIGYIKNVSTIYIIPPHWYDTSSWNCSSCKTRTCLFYIVSVMGANVLAMQGARASASMIFIMLNGIKFGPCTLRVNCISFRASKFQCMDSTMSLEDLLKVMSNTSTDYVHKQQRWYWLSKKKKKKLA